MARAAVASVAPVASGPAAGAGVAHRIFGAGPSAWWSPREEAAGVEAHSLLTRRPVVEAVTAG